MASLPAGASELAEHDTHSELPVTSLYSPRAQGLHAPPSGPVYPAMHVQSVSWMLARGDEEFVGHCVQAWGPEAGLNEPIAHALHVAPSGPV